MDQAGHVVQSSTVIISISGAVGMVPVVYCRGTGFGGLREETPGSTGKLWGKMPVDVGFGPGDLP